jgi:hypothetical protein
MAWGLPDKTPEPTYVRRRVRLTKQGSDALKLYSLALKMSCKGLTPPNYIYLGKHADFYVNLAEVLFCMMASPDKSTTREHLELLLVHGYLEEY